MSGNPYTSPDSKAMVEKLSKTASELAAVKAENKSLRRAKRLDAARLWSRRVGRLVLLGLVIQLVFNVYDQGWLACAPAPVRRIELGRLYAGDAVWSGGLVGPRTHFDEVCLDHETTLNVVVELPDDRDYRVRVYHRGAHEKLAELREEGSVRVPPGCTRFMVEHTSTCDNGAAYSIRVTEVASDG